MASEVESNHVTSEKERVELCEQYRRMYRIRSFELRSGKLYRDGHVPGFVHLAVGQEATAVGACFHMRSDDIITSTHRGHGHALAKGLEPFEIFAELMGKESGVCKGRGGSMHIADPERGIFGANGIVGAGLPIAGGAAFASQLTDSGKVTVAFLGDGAISTGAFHEAANLASLWKLPIVFFCENNRFSEFSHSEDQHPVEFEQRAAGYGLVYRKVDGNDVQAVSELMRGVLDDVRQGGAPYFIQAVTLRHGGHYEGDPQLYRSIKDEDLSVHDPLVGCRASLDGLGVTLAQVEEIERSVGNEIEDGVTRAMEEPLPLVEELSRGVMIPRAPVLSSVVERENHESPEVWKLFQAIGEALRTELEDDPSVFLAGIDVGKGGNVFGITRGMKDQWPDRLRDTPISESAIVGLGTGAAMAGLRPVVELMYMDFIGVCLDQLMNQTAKLPFMTGGRSRMAMTIRTQFGAGKSSGAQHSQSLEAMLAHIPGLTVVMPSTPSDAYGLLRAAIQDPNPVVFVENRLQYGAKGYRCPRDHIVPIGQAAVRRVGADATIVSYSRMAQVSCDAADEMAAEGIHCDVIDLRTIAPLDIRPVLESVEKTNRLLIVHEANRDFGVGAEIAARIADEGIWYLDAPIMRIGSAPTPAPYSPVLESEWLPDRARIVEAVRQLVRI